jgi:hypothetical protein
MDPLVRGTDPWGPDPHQNVTDPQHLLCEKSLLTYLINNFASLKLLKKGVGSGAGSVSLRYESVGSGSASKCHGFPTLAL